MAAGLPSDIAASANHVTKIVGTAATTTVRENPMHGLPPEGGTTNTNQSVGLHTYRTLDNPFLVDGAAGVDWDRFRQHRVMTHCSNQNLARLQQGAVRGCKTFHPLSSKFHTELLSCMVDRGFILLHGCCTTYSLNGFNQSIQIYL